MKLLLALSLFFTSVVCLASTQIIVIGDTGKDNQGQKLVADSLTRHCSSEICDFGLLAGDNIYEEGMSSISDPVLDRVFKKYYGHFPFPFYVSLGNHDYGKFSNDWQRGFFQLEYAKNNPQYHLPHYFYYEVFEDFVLVVLDTSRLMWSKDIQTQEKMINEAYAQAQGKWFVVAGHHPYLSNGKHGNAGNYEKIPFPPFIAGTDVKKFIEKNVCGKAQIYISGHDHNLQLTDGNMVGCNTLFAVSGSGASTEALLGRNKTIFQAEVLGFLAVTIKKEMIALNFIDSNNQTLHKTEIKAP